MRYPKRHSTYGRVIVKTIQLFLGKYKLRENAKTGARTEREKHVLSPLGLTLPKNRVLRPF